MKFERFESLPRGLKAVPRWEIWGPKRLNRIEYSVDEAGDRLLEGEKLPGWVPGWSLKPDKDSLAYIFRPRGKRNQKTPRRPGGASAGAGSGK